MNPICKKIRHEILKISHLSGHGHIASCFSVVEALYAVYLTIKHDPSDPAWSQRDLFILSKGHAALAHYCVLAEFGYFNVEKVYSFGKFLSDFGCHADRFKVPGVEISCGSLGHGIGVACGIALGLKIKRSSRRVVILIGDGEANEGAVWEAIMVAVNNNLSNLTIIYDNNISQVRGLQIYNPLDRFISFGCDAICVDGHNIDAFKKELNRTTDKVKVIVANTKKGYGCQTIVNNHYEWHRKSPVADELKKLQEELDT